MWSSSSLAHADVDLRATNTAGDYLCMDVRSSLVPETTHTTHTVVGQPVLLWQNPDSSCAPNPRPNVGQGFILPRNDSS